MVESIENIAVRKDITKSLEAKIEIKRFTPEDKEALKKEGYLFFESTGKSVNDLRKKGYKIDWSKDTHMRKGLNVPDNDENEPSLRSEVAINPKKLYLEKKYKEILGKRIDPDHREVIDLTDKEAVNNFSKEELAKKAPGAKAIIANPATWAEVTFKHEEVTGEKLFGGDRKDDRYHCTGTETQSVGWNPCPSGRGEGVTIGFQGDKKLSIIDWGGGHGAESTDIAPLIVPT